MIFLKKVVGIFYIYIYIYIYIKILFSHNKIKEYFQFFMIIKRSYSSNLEKKNDMFLEAIYMNIFFFSKCK